jgi:hypothetical protein
VAHNSIANGIRVAKATSYRPFKPPTRVIAYTDEGSIRIWPSQSTVMNLKVGSTAYNDFRLSM